MKRTILLAALGAALTIPAAISAQDHDHDHDRDDHKFYDKHHKDYHQWNDHENLAYHKYWEERHRPVRDWDRASERNRQRYWNWRHEHSDSVLKIDIR
jgi:hypothetical protein